MFLVDRGYHARCVPLENHQGIKSVLVSIGLMLIFLGELRKVVVSRYLLPPTFMIDKFGLLPYFVKVHVEVKMLSCGDHNQKSTNGFHLPGRMDPYVSVAHRLVLDYIQTISLRLMLICYLECFLSLSSSFLSFVSVISRLKSSINRRFFDKIEQCLFLPIQ